MSNGARSEGWREAVNQLQKHIRPCVDAMWDNGGVLHAADVQRIVGGKAEIGRPTTEPLPVAKQYAVVPVSGYQVGAVAAGMPTDTGWCSLYLGANFELRGAAMGFTIHAEQAATNNAWLSG